MPGDDLAHMRVERVVAVRGSTLHRQGLRAIGKRSMWPSRQYNSSVISAAIPRLCSLG